MIDLSTALRFGTDHTNTYRRGRRQLGLPYHRMTTNRPVPINSPMFPDYAHPEAVITLTRRQRRAFADWMERGMMLVKDGLYAAANIHWTTPRIAEQTGIPVARWVEYQDLKPPESLAELSSQTLRLPGNKVVFHSNEGDGCIILSQLHYGQRRGYSQQASQMARHIAHNRAYAGLEEGLHTLQLVLGQYLSKAFSPKKFDVSNVGMAEADIAETMLDQGCPLPANFVSPENGYNRQGHMVTKPPYRTTHFPLIYEGHWPWVQSVSAQLATMPLKTPQTIGRNGQIRIDCPPGFLPDSIGTLEKHNRFRYTLNLNPSRNTHLKVMVLPDKEVDNPTIIPYTNRPNETQITLHAGDWVSLNETVLFQVPTALGPLPLTSYDEKDALATRLFPALPHMICCDQRDLILNTLGANLMQMAQMEGRQPKRRSAFFKIKPNPST